MISQTVATLLRELLAWLAREDRTYAEVMEAWRTNCPRLPVWEEANERGLVAHVRVGGAVMIRVTEAGRLYLGTRSLA